MTSPPTSLAVAPAITGAAAPQSSLPAETAPGNGQALGKAFVDQLAKLLQPAVLTGEPPPAEAPSVQPGSTPGAQARSDAKPAIASPQPQLVLPPLPIIIPQTKQSETQTVQTRGLGSNKSKTEPATPRSRPCATSGPLTVPTVAALPAPDTIAPSPVPVSVTRDGAAQREPVRDQQTVPTVAALPAPGTFAPSPVPVSATRDGTAHHEPVRDQQNDQSTTAGGDKSVSAVSKPAGPDPHATQLDRQQPPDTPTQLAPTQLAPAQPPAEAAVTAVMQSATPAAPTAPSARSVETATPTTVSATTSHSGSPAAQITPALMQIGHAPDGAQRLTVRLDPPELGQVQIKIDRPSDASARVEITVQKQETLTLLLRDQPQLQRALDQAGVPTDGRTVTFHVAPPASSVRTEAGTVPVSGTSAGGLTGDGSHGAAGQHNQPARRRHETTDEDGAEFTPIAARGWLRAGLDITA